MLKLFKTYYNNFYLPAHRVELFLGFVTSGLFPCHIFMLGKRSRHKYMRYEQRLFRCEVEREAGKRNGVIQYRSQWNRCPTGSLCHDFGSVRFMSSAKLNGNPSREVSEQLLPADAGIRGAIKSRF